MCVCYITAVNLHTTTTVNIHIYHTLYIKYNVETQHTRRRLRWLTAATSTATDAFTSTAPTLCRHITSCYMQNNVVMLVWRGARRRCDVMAACHTRARGAAAGRVAAMMNYILLATPLTIPHQPATCPSWVVSFPSPSTTTRRPSDNDDGHTHTQTSAWAQGGVYSWNKRDEPVETVWPEGWKKSNNK